MMGGLLHLVQRAGDWTGLQPTNFILFNVAQQLPLNSKGLRFNTIITLLFFKVKSYLKTDIVQCSNVIMTTPVIMMTPVIMTTLVIMTTPVIMTTHAWHRSVVHVFKIYCELKTFICQVDLASTRPRLDTLQFYYEPESGAVKSVGGLTYSDPLIGYKVEVPVNVSYTACLPVMLYSLSTCDVIEPVYLQCYTACLPVML